MGRMGASGRYVTLYGFMQIARQGRYRPWDCFVPQFEERRVHLLARDTAWEYTAHSYLDFYSVLVFLAGVDEAVEVVRRGSSAARAIRTVLPADDLSIE